MSDATEDGDWFSNLFNAILMYILGGFFAFIGWFMVLLGEPTFFYDTMIGLNLMPPLAKSYTTVIDP